METKSAFGKLGKVFSSKIGPYSLKKMFKIWAEQKIHKKLLDWTSSKDTSQVWCKAVEKS